MVPVVTAAQATAWDDRAVRSGRPLRMLMDAAGRAVGLSAGFHIMEKTPHNVVVVAGRGNNGGDGWVAAGMLHRLGVEVVVRSLGEPTTPEAADARRLALDDGVIERPMDGEWGTAGLIVDAVTGRGLRGEPRGDVATAIARMRDTGLPILSVDVPSGFDFDTGINHGGVVAQMTVCFGGLPRGLLRARDVAGTIQVVDIGLPPVDPTLPLLFTMSDVYPHAPRLRVNDHKGDRGRVLIVGGHAGMSGAARIASRAAFYAGAGLVHVFTDASSAVEIALAEPELLVRVADGTRQLDDADRALIASADVVLIGPGLGREPTTAAWVEQIIALSRRVVLDADGLRAFTGRVDRLAELATATPCILTPHWGEFSALFPGHDPRDPWGAAAAAAASSRATVTLKGVPTVVATPDGRSRTVVFGNPGLATGGSGDLLAGLTAAFWHSLDDPCLAATMAAMALGIAADRGARRRSARALRPTDVLAMLPDLWLEWAEPEAEFFEPDLFLLYPPQVI